jgi:hypothetical protein
MIPSTDPPVEPAGNPADSELMNPAMRARALELLDELGREFPRLRLGQLLCAIAAKADSMVPDSVYDLEDHELIAAAEDWLAYRRANP